MLTMPFVKIDENCATGAPVPDGWQSVADCRCLIIVGLTGVGKTTVLSRLTDQLSDAIVLPNRRTITDIIMFPEVQRHDGLPIQPVADRESRFQLTRRYRELHAGGMAFALNLLSIAPSAKSNLLVFDGLRGENEIRNAVPLLPRAQFLMLDAPDAVRIERLAKRQDAFDQVSQGIDSPRLQSDRVSFDTLGVPELTELLDADEQQRLLALVSSGTVEADELAARARIVLSERRNYDPDATRTALKDVARDRSLIVDTTQLSPERIAEQTIRWLKAPVS